MWFYLTAEELLGTTFHILVEDGHAALIGWGKAEHKLGGRNLSKYQTRHYLHHLTQMEMWDEIEALIVDLCYYEKKNELEQLPALLLELDALKQVLPEDRATSEVVQPISESLRQDIQFITNYSQDYPQGLFQCLWNNGWWHKVRNGGRPLKPLLERWREEIRSREEASRWLRSCRSPGFRSGPPEELHSMRAAGLMHWEFQIAINYWQ